MYLVDTNIFLHVLLKKEKYDVSLLFLKSGKELYITDFSLYSICILLGKLGENKVLERFVDDAAMGEGIYLVKAEAYEISDVIEIEEKYHLDFDDAYQYFIAQKEGLTIISYDKDFDRTEKGRKKPEEIL
jgi:predicted nucleic acid-binding protein